MRKLIIQIPCLNEQDSLPVSLAALPRRVPGFDVVEWLIIDDGSTDRTVEVARSLGVDHVVSMRYHQGLAKGFMAGLEACLKLGADVIVNTDADNQYDASCIPDLVKPILAGEADIVVGARPITEIKHFSPIKKALQLLGSYAVRVASNTTVADAPSGFRAIHREAAFKLMVFNEYTYTIETIIQAGRKGIRITSVPIRVNGDLRPSRLIKSVWTYVRRSLWTIFRIFLVYKPFRFFAWIATFLFTISAVLGLRYIWFLVQGDGAGHIQSLMLASVLAIASFISFALAVVGDLLAVNRTLLEDVRTRLLRTEVAREAKPEDAETPPRMRKVAG